MLIGLYDLSKSESRRRYCHVCSAETEICYTPGGCRLSVECPNAVLVRKAVWVYSDASTIRGARRIYEHDEIGETLMPQQFVPRVFTC